MRSGRRAFIPLAFIVLCFIVLPRGVVRAEGDNLVEVYGRVVDGSSGGPIPDAYVVFWNIQYGSLMVKTDVSGRYEINVTSWESYQVYAYRDLPSTPGFDYVPAYRFISLEGESRNVSFMLLPGASINAVGDFRLPDSQQPLRTVVFTVVDPFGLLDETGAVTRYGETSSTYILGLYLRTVVVPSNAMVKIEVDAYYVGGLERHFTSDYLNLTWGDQLTVDLSNLALAHEIDYAETSLESVQVNVDEAEEKGFYIMYERNRASRVETLLETARSALAEGYYDAAYSDLQEARLIMEDVEGAILSLYTNASLSMFFITPLLGFTAVAIAIILSDDRHQRLAISLILYGVLFGLLYLLYPGYGALQESAYNPWLGTPLQALLTPVLALVSFLVALSMIQGLPYAVREETSMEGLRYMSALAAAFSMAARNLRRRRLRTLLTSAFMLTSVFAFIVLTSFSLEYGLSIQRQTGQAPSEGFLIRKPTVISETPAQWIVTFKPIEQTILQWLVERPEVALVVPKLENTPKVGPVGTLTPVSGLGFDISGVLGVYPSLEAKVTKIDGIIGLGRFLNDSDLDGILISEVAANFLQAEVNDTLGFLGRNFTVTGLFHGSELDRLRDLDGVSMVPSRLAVDGVVMVESCPSEEVVIIHGEIAQELGMVISRIDVQTFGTEDVMSLGREAVLKWPGVEAFTSVAGEIHRLFIGSYAVASGFTASIVPVVLVVLNVGALMLSAVYERKHEVATMSTVGLNPSHITAIFVAEALVMGVVAGSLGYFLGLTSYRFMAVFVPLGVKQKVEAFWGLFALGLSITAAVVGSALPAIKASIITTPSLLKKFVIRLEEKPRTAGEPWLLSMPIRIQDRDVERFFGFMKKQLQTYAGHPYGWVMNLKVRRETDDPTATHLSFTYIYGGEGIATENELSPVKSRIQGRYGVRLASKTRRGVMLARDKADVQRTAAFVRNLILLYSSEQGLSKHCTGDC